MIENDGRGQAPGIRRHAPRLAGDRGPRPGGSGLRAAVIWLVIGALIAGSPRPARAWGRLGHRASARLAESRLSPRGGRSSRTCSSRTNRWPTPPPGPTSTAATSPAAPRWHYVNVPIASAHYDPRDCRARGCVVSKIAEFRADPRRPSRPPRPSPPGLRFFVHLVQDLHQPMHVADRGDRGGNSLQLRSGRYENTNLHQVWDSGLLRSRYRLRDEPELVADLKVLADRPESRGWRAGRIEDWADESLELGRRAYRVPGTDRTLRNGDEIGRAYEQANLPAALDRLAQSGVRLASLLNEILD